LKVLCLKMQPKPPGNKKDTNKFDRKTFSVKKFLSPLTDPHPRVCFRGTGQKVETSQFLAQSTQNSVNLCKSHRE
jgi:hypothetical protein